MSRKQLVKWGLIALVPLLVGTGLALFDVWRNSTTFVTTKDAHVAARIVSAQASAAGQVGQQFVHVGDAVEEGAVVAWLLGPARARINVRAPLSGTVLSLPVDAGASVNQGQPVVTIGDLDNLWVEANVDEARARLVRIGQPAQVRIDAADLTLAGTVEVITPATQAVLSVPAAAAAGGNSRNTATTANRPQGVPVRIALAMPADGAPPGLYPGMSAEVRISVK